MQSAQGILDILEPYLPPQDVLGQMVIAAIVAFSVVQWMKARRRAQRHPRLHTYQKVQVTIAVSFTVLLPALVYLNEIAIAKAVIYAVEGAGLSPLIITAALWCIGKVTPDLRCKLRQERRRPKTEDTVLTGGDRRSSSHDDTTQTGGW